MSVPTVLDKFLNKNFSESDYKDTPWIRNLIETRNLVSVLSNQRDRHTKKMKALVRRHEEAMDDVFNQLTPLGKVSGDLKDTLLDIIYLQDSMIMSLIRVLLDIHHSAKVDYLKEDRKQKEFSREEAKRKSIELFKSTTEENEEDALEKILNEELGITDEEEEEEEEDEGGEDVEQEK